MTPERKRPARGGALIIPGPGDQQSTYSETPRTASLPDLIARHLGERFVAELAGGRT
ncbi:hypothetical protein [Novosphingobium marinum]|uniref:Uncharacterized protein n=1 Tax=Novosphingobium marinum TaxID=1514948 RepID=A0A7Y9XU21_9SPHN|nr:hypothetical protein [Novosphingobium marinum]NYH94540.1 hypothetical protein [Novosphingobium marinum]